MEGTYAVIIPTIDERHSLTSDSVQKSSQPTTPQDVTDIRVKRATFAPEA